MKTATRFFSILVVVLGSALALSACGGSGSDISKDSLQEMSSTTLQQTKARIKNLKREVKDSGSPEENKKVWEEWEAILNEEDRRYDVIMAKAKSLGACPQEFHYRCASIVLAFIKEGWWEKTDGMTSVTKGTPEAKAFANAFYGRLSEKLENNPQLRKTFHEYERKHRKHGSPVPNAQSQAGIFRGSAGEAIKNAAAGSYVLSEARVRSDFPALADCKLLGTNVFVCMDAGATSGDVYVFIPRTDNRAMDIKQLWDLDAALKSNTTGGYTVMEKPEAGLFDSPIIPKDHKALQQAYWGGWYEVRKK